MLFLSFSARRRSARPALFAAVLLAYACSGDSPTNRPDPVARVDVTSPATTVAVGDTLALTAVPRSASGAALGGRAVEWSSSDPAVLKVDGSGRATGERAGTATVTARSEGQTGQVAITVTPPAVAALTLSRDTATLHAGTTLQLSATPRDRFGNALSGRAVSWTSSAEAVARVDGSGLVTAVAPGTAAITASSEGRTAQATITVVPVPIASLALSPDTATLVVGATLALRVTARDAAGNELGGRPVMLVSSNSAVATLDGLTVRAAGPGTTTITASAEGRTAQATITVRPVPVAAVEVSPATATVEVGRTVDLGAIARDAQGNALTGRVVSWSSSNAGLATVSATGVVTGLAAGGPVTITATVEGRTGTAAITVVPRPVAAVEVSPASATLEVGRTVNLGAIARDAEGNVLTGRAVTWSSANPGVATVSPAGVVTGVSAGSAQITATVEGKTASATISVVAPPPLTRVWESAPAGIAGPAAVHGGRMYAVDQNVGRLDVLDASNGAVLWRASLGGSAYSTYPVVDRLGNVYVGGPDHVLRSFTPGGTARWQLNVGTEARMAVSGDTLYASTSSGVTAYTLGGTQLWQTPNTGGHLLVYAGRIYTVGGGAVTAIDRATGSVLWRLNPATEPIFASGAVGSDGTVYVGSLDRNVYAISAAGTLRWSAQTGEIRAAPVESNGVVYVGSVGRRLYALDGASGAVRWDVAVPFDINVAPAVARDGSVYVVSDRVYRVSSTGTIISSATADSRSHLTIDEDGFLYLSGTAYQKLHGSGAPAPGWPQFQGNARHSGTR